MTFSEQQRQLIRVDPSDEPLLKEYTWVVMKSHNTCYAYRWTEGRFVAMHRELLGLRKEDKVHVDHINQDGLDNRRRNLRICTSQQNQWNTPKRRGASRFKGVHWQTREGKWRACIRTPAGKRYLGTFESEEDAATVYNVAAQLFHGDFAWLNDV